VWAHCADELSEALQELGCINHTMTALSSRLMLPHNASVLEVANAYALAHWNLKLRAC
jgi:hypothetical protein